MTLYFKPQIAQEIISDVCKCVYVFITWSINLQSFCMKLTFYYLVMNVFGATLTNISYVAAKV